MNARRSRSAIRTPQSEPGGRSAFGIARINAGTARGSPIAPGRMPAIVMWHPDRCGRVQQPIRARRFADRGELANRLSPLLVAAEHAIGSEEVNQLTNALRLAVCLWRLLRTGRPRGVWIDFLPRILRLVLRSRIAFCLSLASGESGGRSVAWAVLSTKPTNTQAILMNRAIMERPRQNTALEWAAPHCEKHPLGRPTRRPAVPAFHLQTVCRISSTMQQLPATRALSETPCTSTPRPPVT